MDERSQLLWPRQEICDVGDDWHSWPSGAVVGQVQEGEKSSTREYEQVERIPNQGQDQIILYFSFSAPFHLTNLLLAGHRRQVNSRR